MSKIRTKLIYASDSRGYATFGDLILANGLVKNIPQIFSLGSEVNASELIEACQQSDMDAETEKRLIREFQKRFYAKYEREARFLMRSRATFVLKANKVIDEMKQQKVIYLSHSKKFNFGHFIVTHYDEMCGNKQGGLR